MGVIKMRRRDGADTCPRLEARLTLTDIVSSGWRDTVETRPRLIVLNGFESVLTDAFSLFNLSRDPREKRGEINDTRAWVVQCLKRKKKLEFFSYFENIKFLRVIEMSNIFIFQFLCL